MCWSKIQLELDSIQCTGIYEQAYVFAASFATRIVRNKSLV